MKKILPILVVGILVLSGLGAVASRVNNYSLTVDNKTISVSVYDDLDQYQIEKSLNCAMVIGQCTPITKINVQLAQSFIPTKEILTRVELFIGKNSSVIYPFFLAIRKTLTDEDLVLTSIEPEDVPTEDFGWVEINFNDIVVNTGETYYIVSYTENIADNFYACGGNENPESYPNGSLWYSIDDGKTWSDENPLDDWFNIWDMCFKTYGIDNSPPDTPDIDGPPHGKPGVEYTFCITPTDPDGDDFHVKWDWGDGTSTDWSGPYASGTEVCESHKWSKSGRYIIKVTIRDDYGATVTASLEFIIPRTRPWLRFFDMFPILQRMLDMLRV